MRLVALQDQGMSAGRAVSQTQRWSVKDRVGHLHGQRDGIARHNNHRVDKMMKSCPEAETSPSTGSTGHALMRVLLGDFPVIMQKLRYLDFAGLAESQRHLTLI